MDVAESTVMKGEPRESVIFHGKHNQTSEEKCAIAASKIWLAYPTF